MERATIQVATMRVISNSDSIDKHEVIERVERARSILDGGKMISLSTLADQVVTTDEWQALDPIDQSYLALLFNQIQANSAGVDHILNAEDRQTIATLLSWVEEAAQFVVEDDAD